MALVFTYGDRRANWTAVDLGQAAVRLGKWAVTSKAYMGEIGTSTIPIDDPDGNVGHDGDQILGLKLFTIYETACATDNTILFAGFTRDRRYSSEDSLITGAAVRINVDLADRNDEGHYYLIPGDDEASGNRPAETVDERIAWLLASTYIALADNGLVASSSVSMPATNYGNQTGADVLDQCALAAGFNWGLYFDEAADEESLRFYDPNTSTLETVDLRISNTLSDIDSNVRDGVGATQTWAPSTKVEMTRSPQDTAALYRVPWSHGTVEASRSSTADTYGRIDAVAPDANLTTEDSAIARANFLLWQHRNEEDTFAPISLQLPPAHVNDVKEGSRISCRFRNMPGYHDWSWFRVTSRTVGQEDETDEFYTVTLELSPCESGGVSDVQPPAVERHQDSVDFANATTVDSLLVTVQTWRQLLTSPQPPDDGETWTQVPISGVTGDVADFLKNTDSDNNALVAYATICTIAQAAHHKQGATGGDSNGTVVHSVMYELSGAGVGDINAVGIELQGSGTSLSAGSVGTVFPTQKVIFAGGCGYDGFGTLTVTPGSLVRDFFSGRDEDTTSSNALYYEGFPGTWYGHQQGDGSSLTPAISIDVASKHAAIALVIG